MSWLRTRATTRLAPGLVIVGLLCAGCGPKGGQAVAVGAPSPGARPAASPWREAESGKPNVKRIEVDTQGGSNIVVHMVSLREAVTVENVRDTLRDKTRLTYDPSHGMQIEYSSTDGKVYLWYPGNQAILPGQWKAEPYYVEFVENGRALRRVDEAKVCFRYGPNTFNPATGHVGAGWQCAPLAELNRYQAQTASGDVFGLRTRTEVPFVLPRERMTLDALRSRIGS
ncbi:hypothetical protein [uncultured Methylobacterium sp.]|uniref:hypothetical protein n=1 Tax=uncultured Methylobacterium sp. TaxID=157278 RepID=UPI0025954378|nr:hypothetical protein [uncultured Methylobacterium sp.]